MLAVTDGADDVREDSVAAAANLPVGIRSTLAAQHKQRDRVATSASTSTLGTGNMKRLGVEERFCQELGRRNQFAGQVRCVCSTRVN